MEEGTIWVLTAAISVLIGLFIPVWRFLRTNVYPRSVVFIDHNGKELGEISPEFVHQTDVKTLERMHDRVVGEKHLRIRAVA